MYAIIATIINIQYILRLNFLSPTLSVLPLDCFTTAGASHYYTYIYASYVIQVTATMQIRSGTSEQFTCFFFVKVAQFMLLLIC